MTTNTVTRRTSLQVGVAATAVGLAAATGARPAAAQSAADLLALNALLRAEYQAVALYDSAIPRLNAMPSAVAFAASATSMKAQHQAHAARLAGLVTQGGGTPTAMASGFTPPAGFTPTVTNLLRLFANVEKTLSVAYVTTLATLSWQDAAGALASIGGVHAQHFIVWYTVAVGVFTPGAMAAMGIVPDAFVTTASGPGTSLESLPDLTFISNA